MIPPSRRILASEIFRGRESCEAPTGTVRRIRLEGWLVGSLPAERAVVRFLLNKWVSTRILANGFAGSVILGEIRPSKIQHH
jgi:hypothetical protein